MLLSQKYGRNVTMVRASMLVAGFWAAVAVTGCGVGGEEGASVPSSLSSGASVSSSSVASGWLSSSSPMVLKQDPSPVSVDRMIAEEPDDSPAESEDADRDEDEEAALVMLM